MSDDELVRAIQDRDVARLTRVPGIGKKTAERLILDLRDKLDVDVSSSPSSATLSLVSDPTSEAVTALVALGYKPNEASRMVRAVSSPGLETEEIIRQALKAVAI